MSAPKPELVEQAVTRAQAGDPEAFAWLVARFTPLLMGFLFGQLKSREDCEDVAQVTFVEAHKNLVHLRVHRTFPQWLLKLATHNLIDFKRRRGAQRRGGALIVVPLDQMEADVESGAPRPDGIASGGEMNALILRELEALDEQKRSVVHMRLIGELSFAEIAEALEITEEAVRMRLSRGLKLLRQRLLKAGFLDEAHKE